MACRAPTDPLRVRYNETFRAVRQLALLGRRFCCTKGSLGECAERGLFAFYGPLGIRNEDDRCPSPTKMTRSTVSRR